VVREGRTPNLVMTPLPRHELQLVKVIGLYVSKGIHFGLLIRRTTVNISVKYPGKLNLLQINSEIIISGMFVKWIVVPNFELQIAYVQYCLAEVATDPESIQQMAHWGGAQGQANMAKITQNHPYL